MGCGAPPVRSHGCVPPPRALLDPRETTRSNSPALSATNHHQPCHHRTVTDSPDFYNLQRTLWQEQHKHTASGIDNSTLRCSSSTSPSTNMHRNREAAAAAAVMIRSGGNKHTARHLGDRAPSKHRLQRGYARGVGHARRIGVHCVPRLWDRIKTELSAPAHRSHRFIPRCSDAL